MANYDTFLVHSAGQVRLNVIWLPLNERTLSGNVIQCVTVAHC
jgi:hypothetical protein